MSQVCFDLRVHLEGTCRACSRYFDYDDDIKFFRIFDISAAPTEEVRDIYEELVIWKLNIEPNDRLPQQICHDCVTRFRSVKLFREECLGTQRLLESYFKDIDTLLEPVSNNGSPKSSPKSESDALRTSNTFNADDIVEESPERLQRLSPTGSPKFQEAVYAESSLGTPPQIFEEITTEPIDVRTMEYIKAEADLEPKSEQNLETSSPQHFYSSNYESQSSTTDDEDDDDTQTVTDIESDLEYDFQRNKHVALNPLQCKICLLNFDNRSQLKDHHLRIHPQEKPYACNICASTFKSNFLLSQHKLKHNRPDSIQCEQCGKYFRSQLHMQRHAKNFHLTSTYTCHICHEIFENYTQIRFQYHVRQHGEKRFHCQFCEKSFHQKVHLANHERSHTKEQPFHCNICGKSYRQQTACQEHMLTHKDPTPFKCKICFKGFTQRSSLRLHLRTHGEIEKNETCGQNYAQKSHFKMLELSHSGSAVRKMQLMETARIQKPRKTIKHQFCDESLMKLQNKEAFNCNLCNKSFLYCTALRKHMLSHLDAT